MKAASPVVWVFQKIKKKIPALVLLMASNVAGAGVAGGGADKPVKQRCPDFK